MNKQKTNKKLFKNFIVIAFVIFWCVCSSCFYLEQQKELHYKLVDTECNTIEILQGDIFVQEIKINKYIENLRLSVANGGGNRAETNTGSIEFILSQGDIVETATIGITGIQDWTYIDVPVDLDKFNDGMAQLQIKGIDTKAGSSIYFISLKDDIYELPAATYNNSKLDGPLTIEYTTYNSNFNGSYFVVLMALIILVGVALVLLLTYNPKDMYIYFTTTILVALIIAVRYPTYTIGGEAWAEAGVLYIPTAMNSTFIGNLLTLESGLYINIMARLIAWFFVKTMPSIYYALHGINISSLIILSFMGAALSSGVFKKYIRPVEGVVISILITTCLVDGETIATPLITAYWGIIPLIIIMTAMVLQINIPKKLFIFWSVLVALSILSRMAFVIFIPIIILYIIWFRRKLTKTNTIYISILGLLCLTEGVLSLVVRNIHGITEGGPVSIQSPVALIKTIFYNQVQIINSIFKIQASDNFISWNISALIALIVLIIMLLWLIATRKHTDFAKGALLILAISFGQSSLLLITEGHADLVNQTIWSVIQSLPRNREWFFCYIAILLLLLFSFKYYKYKICIENDQKTKISEKIIIGCVLLVAFCVQPTSSYISIYDITKDLGDWNNYSEMMRNESYCTVVEPNFPMWESSENCIIQEGQIESTQQIDLNTELSEVISFYISRYSLTNQIEYRPYYITVYDKNGKEIDTIMQTSDLEESLIGFNINTKMEGLSKIAFHYEDGSSAYVEGEYVLGYK